MRTGLLDVKDSLFVYVILRLATCATRENRFAKFYVGKKIFFKLYE